VEIRPAGGRRRQGGLAGQQQTLRQKLRGHFNYYGITGNAVAQQRDSRNRMRSLRTDGSAGAPGAPALGAIQPCYQAGNNTWGQARLTECGTVLTPVDAAPARFQSLFLNTLHVLHTRPRESQADNREEAEDNGVGRTVVRSDHPNTVRGAGQADRDLQ
jgi:hypothetical protein